VSAIAPWQPEDETLQQYIHRIVHTAPVPNSEQSARLAALLRLGARGGDSDA
jgi:hypothetical protein